MRNELLKKLAAGMHVLVVDDEATFRWQIAHRLRNLGMFVTEACDGDAGWLEFVRGDFTLVITDFSMPGKNGAELARQIRQQKPESHVILLTALERQEEVQTTFGADLQVYLVAKSGMERKIVGIEDALLMALALIENAKPKPKVKTPLMGGPGSALARLLRDWKKNQDDRNVDE